MKVKSTGLGKTQLTSHIDGFYIKDDGTSAVMVIESTEPVHWHIECDMGGDDLRQFARFVLKPHTLISLLRLLVQGGEAKGFVMAKEKGARRAGGARKDRPSADASLGGLSDDSGAEAAPATVSSEAAPATQIEVLQQPTAAAAPPPLVSLQALRETEASSRDGERGQREQRRAERRRRREQAAQAQPTAG